MVRIIQKDSDPKGVLRARAQAVPQADIGSQKLKKVIFEMLEAMASQDDAVAIAAPQIGYLIRLFIISDKVFEQETVGEHSTVKAAHHTFINPTITRRSRKKVDADEGCLSVRPFYGIVPRSEKVTLRSLDEKGRSFTYSASGLLAQIFQHETDHLDGILFTDRAKETWKVEPDKTHGSKKTSA